MEVKLEVFEGPLDLLLYLVRKDELDIYNIPIAVITDQYMEYLNLMKILDVDIASEFLVMAATLLQMKSEAMLPSGAMVEYDEPMLTREELVRQLLEYRKFKDAAAMLARKEEAQKDLYVRSFLEPAIEDFEIKEFKIEATLFDLLSVFRKILKKLPEEGLMEFYEETVTVQQKIEEILKLLRDRKRIEFSSLFSIQAFEKDLRLRLRSSSKRVQGASAPWICTRLEIIVTFLAVLELVRTRQIIARQSQLFGRIWLYKGRNEQRAYGS